MAKKPKTFKWTVEIEVDESWVADGFDMKTPERLNDMIAHALPYAYPHEFSGRVIKAPRTSSIAATQGYKSVAEWRKDGGHE